LLLCQLRGKRSQACGGFCVGEEGSIDDVGESAFEDAKRFGVVLAVLAAALQEPAGRIVVVGLGDRNSVVAALS
jgi:hypothetical protein